MRRQMQASAREKPKSTYIIYIRIRVHDTDRRFEGWLFCFVLSCCTQATIYSTPLHSRCKFYQCRCKFYQCKTCNAEHRLADVPTFKDSPSCAWGPPAICMHLKPRPFAHKQQCIVIGCHSAPVLVSQEFEIHFTLFDSCYPLFP